MKFKTKEMIIVSDEGDLLGTVIFSTLLEPEFRSKNGDEYSLSELEEIIKMTKELNNLHESST